MGAQDFGIHRIIAFASSLDTPHLLVFLFFSAMGLVVGAAILQFIYAMLFLPDPRIALRESAHKLGFTVEEVERDMPTIYPDNSVKIEKDRCMKYTLSQHARHDGDWSLLQRFHDKSPLPNGYVVEAERVTPALLDKLRPFAKHFDEEFYEFERRVNTLAVFWTEGGEEDLQRIYKMFSELEDA